MKFLITTLVLALVLSGPALAGKKDTTVGTNATEWSSDTIPDANNGIYPIEGAGQLNGEFVVVDRDGIQIGLRATDRTDGLLIANGKKTGVYFACTGEEAADRAEWNYDFHLDLRGTGTTLADYILDLSQTYADSYFGYTGRVDLSFPEFYGDSFQNAVLFQGSVNPNFGNDTFDPYAEDTYNLVLKLTPRGPGQPLVAHIRIDVADCD